MATVKLYAIHRIIRQGKDGNEEVVLPKTVFDGTTAEAKSHDALGSARPATAAEVKAADDLRAKAAGLEPDPNAPEEVAVTPNDVKPSSDVSGDPQALPKAKAR